MPDDRFAQLIARHFSGMATEEELIELQTLLDKDPEARYFFGIFSDYWNIHPQSHDDTIQDEIHFQQILAIAEKTPVETEPVKKTEEVEEVRTRFITPVRLMAAAAILLVVLSAYWYFTSQPASKPAPLAWNEVVAQPATRTSMRLPDGTRVWLNSGSRLEYQASFNDSVREVNLEGEAFFDVVRDEERPFIVHTSDIDIRVLGTAFNVKSYPQDASIEATLIHGMIEVIHTKEPTSPKVLLKPHQKLVFNKKTEAEKEIEREQGKELHQPFAIMHLPQQVPDTAIVETSWVYDKLVVDGESFSEMARKMERWYNVRISITDEKIAAVPIHASFHDESIEEALRALQLIVPFRYEKKDNEIEIVKK